MMRRIVLVLPFLLLGACAPAPEPVPAPLPEPQPTPTAQPAPAPTAQPAPAPGAQDAQRAAAQQAAEAWLRHVDAGDYRRSWAEGGQMFRQGVTEQQWDEALSQARRPLGAVESRTLRDAQLHRDLPGAPAGEYMVLIYEARYAGAAQQMTEQVVLAREDDGQWRVAGYFVR